MTTLPILIPGRSEPVNVPCRLPESFDFRAFLPSRGVRIFTCWLTSTDPLTAEVKDAQLARRETDPRLKEGFELDADEQRRADEAAGDVLDGVLRRLGLIPPTREPHPYGPDPALHGIALAWSAEEEAQSRQSAMCLVLGRAGIHMADTDAGKLVPDLESYWWQEKSPSCVAMAGYVAHALEQAVLAQADKADRQQATWEPAQAHPEDRNSPEWAH